MRVRDLNQVLFVISGANGGGSTAQRPGETVLLDRRREPPLYGPLYLY